MQYNDGLRIIEKEFKKVQTHVKRYGICENDAGKFERKCYDLLFMPFHSQYATFSKLMEVVYSYSERL